MPNGLKRRLRPSKQRKLNATNAIMTTHSRAAALEVGDVVLFHVTTFKGHHKIQERWENGEYVVERGPILMYQFMWYTPGMGKGTAGPYIGTICFLSAPI